MGEPYRRQRTFYQDISDNLSVAAGTDDTTLVTVKSGYTIFLQKAHVQITQASAGKSWQITGSDGLQLTGPFPTDTDGSHYDMDFGPKGVQLTAGTNLVLDVSLTGAAGQVTWEGYQRVVAL